tara:strand:- start:293 stop:1078 length:786 start_codon:yes stop_codon:yes gene_type:complete
MHKYINLNSIIKSLNKFGSKKPFPYTIIDGFFKKEIAKKLEAEFPKYNDKILHVYDNYCEVKKSSNNWNLFPPLTYKIFSILNSEEFLRKISKKIKSNKLFPDFGLNGGGWHLMNRKGKLNPHLDYFLHPKTEYQRKFNLIIFLSSNWKEKWGGETCFYSKNLKNKKLPGRLEKKIYPKFNRAIIFDTTKTSWHSVEKIKLDKIRKSIAVYYLIEPQKNNLINRKKALYAPTHKQLKSKKILNFIKLRSNPNYFSKVYKTK